MKPTVVVDVGNSRIKWGRCAADRVTELASLPHDDDGAWQRQRLAWKLPNGSTWALSGVRPKQRDRINDWLKHQDQQVVCIDSYRQLPLDIDVGQPAKIGLDRLLNAVAVNGMRTPGTAAVIVDAGTAVTVDYVDAGGVFRGGAIMPGLGLMARSLHDYTALLPLIDVIQFVKMPAKSTEDAVRAGILHAVLGGIESLLNQLAAPTAELFLAGGDAGLLAPHLSRPARIWPEMTLEGIRLVA